MVLRFAGIFLSSVGGMVSEKRLLDSKHHSYASKAYQNLHIPHAIELLMFIVISYIQHQSVKLFVVDATSISHVQDFAAPVSSTLVSH